MGTPDAYDQWCRHDAMEAEQLKRYPVCSYCGEHIQDDHLFRICDLLVCEACLIDNFRVNTEDYME